MLKALSQSPGAIRKRAARLLARSAHARAKHAEVAAALHAAAAGTMGLTVAKPNVVAPAAVAAAVAEVARGETFKFVGYAVDTKGRGAVRYTNDKRRTRTLVRNGCTEVKFVELPKPMTKEQIDASKFIAQVKPAAAQAA